MGYKEEDTRPRWTNANLNMTLKCECLLIAVVHLSTGDKGVCAHYHSAPTLRNRQDSG